MVTRICLKCNKDFEVYLSKIKEGKAKYCSKECQYRTMRGKPFFDRIGMSPYNKGLKLPQFSGENHPRYVKRIKRKCLICGGDFDIERWRLKDKSRGKYCSPQCSDKRNGKLASNWRGGKAYIGEGYILIQKPNHPFSRKNGYVCEHRLVMEKHLGRYLGRKEVVHHLNGKRNDNSLINLQIMTTQEHSRLHALENRLGKHG